MRDLRPNHTNQASDATTERILKSAKRVLIEHGYARFTTRRVASVAGISVGNLSYHFPSKQGLLQALVAHLVAKYLGQFQVILADPNIPTEEDLETLVEWLLTDAIEEETVRVFRELWAISLHDQVIRDAMDNFYDDVMSQVVEMLTRYYPSANIDSIRELAQVLAHLSEGSVVLYGTRRNRAVSHKRIIELAVRFTKTMHLDLKKQPTDAKGVHGGIERD